MRPTEPTTDEHTYECRGCADRVVEPATRTCEECGGQLCNISRARDL